MAETTVTKREIKSCNNNKNTSYAVWGGKYTGRKEILTSVSFVNEGNILEVLREAIQTHDINRNDIEYLYKYYKGDQPILTRLKTSGRTDINNHIVENRANEIVSFKVGYLVGEPIQYVGRAEDDCVDAIQQLNVYMADVDKDAADVELATWMHICGLGYRMVLPRHEMTDDDESPFDVYTLDPRDSFVVKYNGLDKHPVMGVKFVEDPNKPGVRIYSIYTPTQYFEIVDEKIVKVTGNPIGIIPIVEYPLNQARLGAFEIVLTQLDALNVLNSDRLDNVEQIVSALLLFHNVDVDSQDVDKLNAMGAIKFKDVDPQTKGEIKYITAELNQGGTQTLKEDIYESVLTICGMPNRNGGYSTSDTGSAVIMRDGWSDAEARAKDTEKWFKRSEKNMLRIVLKICREIAKMKLHLSNVEPKFTRRNYENGLTKANILTMMLANEKIAPRLAFIHCGMFTDPESAYAESEEYFQKNKLMEMEEQTSLMNGSANTEEEDTKVISNVSGSSVKTHGNGKWKDHKYLYTEEQDNGRVKYFYSDNKKKKSSKG